MYNRKPTIKELKSTYTEERARNDRMSGPAVYFIMRPLSYYPTWLAIRMGISANIISVISLLIMLGGCALIALGNYATILIGAVLLNIYHLLDSVDGNVARHTGKAGSPFGSFIEHFGSLMDKALIIPCAGIGAYLHAGFFPLEINGWIFIGFGVAAALINFTAPKITALIQSQPVVSAFEDTNRMDDFPLYRKLLQSIGGNYLLLILVCAVFNILGVYVIIELCFALGNVTLRNIKL